MRVLIVEYLHASSDAYQQASDSMRAEGRTMLDAMIEDLSRLPDAFGTIALCDNAAKDVFPNGATILSVADSPESDFAEQLLTACGGQAFDKVLLVAPECDNILANVTRRLRHQQFDVVGLSLQAILLCSDKLATNQFLQRQRIPSIPTRPLTEFAKLQTSDQQQVVVKPQGGAGCEGIVRLSTAELNEQLAAIQTRTSASAASPATPIYLQHPDRFIVQPFIDAQSYSIGMIGQGEGRPAWILPVAEQNICWQAGRPSYGGGVIGVNIAQENNTHITKIAAGIASVLKIGSGYVGIDFLIDNVTAQIFITEINPRLCTSYAGYRNATTSNLLAAMLHRCNITDVDWSSAPIPFGT